MYNPANPLLGICPEDNCIYVMILYHIKRGTVKRKIGFAAADSAAGCKYPQSVMLKKLELNGSAKTYKTF